MDNSAEYKIDANFRWFRTANKANEELYLEQCGIEQCTPGKYYGPTVREEYHIHFILSGEGVFEANNVSYHLGRGQIFVAVPGVEHYYYADSENPWSYTWISLDGTRAGSFLEKAGITPAHPVREAYADPQKFLAIVEKILNHHKLTLVDELIRTSLLYKAVALLVESGNQSHIQHTHKKHDYSADVYVNSATEYIKGNYAHIRVSDIATYLGISRYYLSHIFKEKLQVSPQEYLVKYRLKKGEELLRTTSLSIQAISDKTGYENPLTFSKIFKRIYGLSPKNYRSAIFKKSGTPD